MIRVRVGTTTETKTVLVDDNKTLREVYEDNDIEYAQATSYVDGAPISMSDLDSTFKDLGLAESCSLMAIINTKNA